MAPSYYLSRYWRLLAEPWREIPANHIVTNFIQDNSLKIWTFSPASVFWLPRTCVSIKLCWHSRLDTSILLRFSNDESQIFDLLSVIFLIITFRLLLQSFDKRAIGVPMLIWSMFSPAIHSPITQYNFAVCQKVRITNNLHDAWIYDRATQLHRFPWAVANVTTAWLLEMNTITELFISKPVHCNCRGHCP